MKIINETSLSYKAIGSLIDHIQNAYKGETMYIGKTEEYFVGYEDKEIIISIRYLKSYAEWRFYEK